MPYISDDYNFDPITLTGEQHRRFAEITEDLYDRIEDFELASRVLDLVLLMIDAGADEATSAK